MPFIMRVAIAHYLKNNFTFAIKNTKIIFSFDSHIPLKCMSNEKYEDSCSSNRYAIIKQQGKDIVMTLIIENASSEFAEAINNLAKIANAAVCIQTDKSKEKESCLIEETDIYNDFQARKATNPKQYAQLTQEVKDEIFGINHQ